MRARTTLCCLAAATALVTSCSSAARAPGETTSAPERSPTPSPAQVTAPPNTPTGVPAGVRPIPLDLGAPPATVAFGFGSVWVGSHRGTQLYRIDPKTDRVTASIPAGRDACTPLVGRRYGTLAEFDATTLKALRMVHTPAFDEPIARGGRIWLQLTSADGDFTGTVLGVDPRTAKLVARVKIPGDPGLMEPMSYASGALWLVDGTRHALLRVDPATHAFHAYPIPHYEQFSNYFRAVVIAVSGSHLWFRASPGTVTEFDARTRQFGRRYPDDPAAGGCNIGVGYGSIWEANLMSDTLWRVPTG